jgi:hypothetical protein
MGFDPSKIMGFTLSTYEGNLPILTVQHIPPYDGQDAEEWEAALAAAMKTYRLVDITDDLGEGYSLDEIGCA